jgi:hypothetical protein
MPGHEEIQRREAMAGIEAAASAREQGKQSKQPQTVAPFAFHTINHMSTTWLTPSTKLCFSSPERSEGSELRIPSCLALHLRKNYVWLSLLTKMEK